MMAQNGIKILNSKNIIKLKTSLTRGNQISREGCGEGTSLLGRHAAEWWAASVAVLQPYGLLQKWNFRGCNKQTWRKWSMIRREAPLPSVWWDSEMLQKPSRFLCCKIWKRCTLFVFAAVRSELRVDWAPFEIPKQKSCPKHRVNRGYMQPCGVTAVRSILVCLFCNFVILTNACLCVTMEPGCTKAGRHLRGHYMLYSGA